MSNKHDLDFSMLETTDVPGDTLDSQLTDLALHVHQRPDDVLEVTTRYIVGSVLGQGGCGIVYRAHDELLGRDVAVKVLRNKFLDRREIVERFKQESSVTSYLQHLGIPPIHEGGVSDDGRPFHSMKLVTGCTLRKMINDGAPNKCIDSLNVFAQVCQIMAYAHCEGVIHQDLKPGNVMVGPFGEVHVMDWGQARHLVLGNGTNSARTAGLKREKLHVGGTLGYMSPEQARNQAPTKQFDVFSLGATLCHLLTGLPPYTGNTRHGILKQAENAELDEAMRRLDRCGFDSQVIRLAKRCMSLDPEKRPADAAAVGHEISAYRQTAFATTQKRYGAVF